MQIIFNPLEIDTQIDRGAARTEIWAPSCYLFSSQFAVREVEHVITASLSLSVVSSANNSAVHHKYVQTWSDKVCQKYNLYKCSGYWSDDTVWVSLPWWSS